MRVVMAVVAMMVVVVMLLAQQKGADDVDNEAEHGDRDRLAIGDGHGVDQPLKTLEGDLDRDNGEDDGAGKGGEIAELSGAEGEMAVARLAAGKEIGERGNAERRRMGCHVPAVGEQRHRAEQDAGDDLADHHDRGQRDHKPGAALIAGVLCAEKDVVVRPPVEGMGVHGLVSERAASRGNSASYNVREDEYYHTSSLRPSGSSKKA